MGYQKIINSSSLTEDVGRGEYYQIISEVEHSSGASHDGHGWTNAAMPGLAMSSRLERGDYFPDSHLN